MDSLLNMSEFITQLQQINFSSIIAFLAPSILYYSISYAIKKPIKANYNLKKDFKIGYVTTAQLPPKIIQRFDSIDEEELLKKEFGDAIINFATTVNKKNVKINLATFLNNLNTIKTTATSFDDCKINSNKVLGQYNVMTNTISLSKGFNKSTINHELFHASTSVIDHDNHIVYCGFEQSYNNNSIGTGLNEGYTEYLTGKYFGNDDSSSGYFIAISVVKFLEKIIGEEEMEQLYFNNNLQGLINCLKEYATEDEIFKFINILDFITEHIYDDYLTKSSLDLLYNNLHFINTFLIKIYSRKNLIGVDINALSDNDVKKIIGQLPSLPISVVKKGIGFNNYKYSIDYNDVAKTITSVINEYKADCKEQAK